MFLRAFSGIMFVLSLVFLLPIIPTQMFSTTLFLFVSIVALVLQIVWAILTLHYMEALRKCGCESSMTANENEWSAILVLLIVLLTVVIGGGYVGYIYARATIR